MTGVTRHRYRTMTAVLLVCDGLLLAATVVAMALGARHLALALLVASAVVMAGAGLGTMLDSRAIQRHHTDG